MNGRKIYLDVLKCLSILAVISIHVTSNTVHNVKLFKTFNWWIAFILDSSSRWSVPVFIMISGTLLLGKNKQVSPKEFLKKRFSRLLIPFIFWSSFYYIYTQKTSLFRISIIRLIKALLQGGIYYHLWYMYIIIGIYLVVPILVPYIKNTTMSDIGYFLIMGLISNCIFPLLSKFYNIKIGISIPIVTGFIFIFILGYYLDNINLTKQLRLIIYLLGFTGLFITIYETYNLSPMGYINEYFYGNLQLNTVLVASAIFTFTKYCFYKFNTINRKLINKIESMSKTTFGMYLIHPFILSKVQKLSVGLLTIPIKIFVTFIISFIIVFILQKIVFVRRVVL